jgi:CRISPR/Cas system endoribonuclease Cas6 (RAMP superfamily)
LAAKRAERRAEELARKNWRRMRKALRRIGVGQGKAGAERNVVRLLTREEAAEVLRVSTKKIQRMEASGQLRRCRGLTGVVRYLASDVLRLASAERKED